MTPEQLLSSVGHALQAELGMAFCDDQTAAIRRAILSVITSLMAAGALTVPRFTPAEEMQLRNAEPLPRIPGDRDDFVAKR